MLASFLLKNKVYDEPDDSKKKKTEEYHHVKVKPGVDKTDDVANIADGDEEADEADE